MLQKMAYCPMKARVACSWPLTLLVQKNLKRLYFLVMFLTYMNTNRIKLKLNL